MSCFRLKKILMVFLQKHYYFIMMKYLFKGYRSELETELCKTSLGH